MDINSLLSPQESPADETPPPSLPSSSRASPGKRSLRQPLPNLPSRTPSYTSQHHQITSSPHYHSEHYQSHHYHQHSHSHPHVTTGTPLASPRLAGYQNGRATHTARSTPPVDPRNPYNPIQDARVTPPQPPIHRSSSTPGMDTLADLASMQQQQQAARQNAGGLRDPQVYQAQRPSIRFDYSTHPTAQHNAKRPHSSLQNIPRSISGSSADITMAETPRQPRDFVSAALDKESLVTLKELDQTLIENPFDYNAHTRFIGILHRGLQNHMYPEDGSTRDAHTYELVSELREAYAAMDKIYPLGEALSEDWLNDERALARPEDRYTFEEKFVKALKDEPKSVRLWVLYGEYMSYLYACANDANPPEQWSPADREVGQQIWTWEVILNVWERGAEATIHNPKDSHRVWNRYAQMLLEDLQRSSPPEKVRRISTLFEERLALPHESWDETFQMFSSFTSQYNAVAYEDIMELVSKRTANAKHQYQLRADREFAIDKAVQSQDRYAEHAAYTKYLKWETRLAGPFSFHMVNSLFERALLRFPADASIWEDYVEFLVKRNDPSVSLLEVLERATRHCPWSGSIWSHRIMNLEAENKDFNEIERVKHNATETGLLEHGGLEELLKVQVAWCGYLRRKALDNPNSSDDDVDVAEVGIRSALDDVRAIGVKKYGDAYTGDPQYRLERIHIKFFTQNGNVDGARAIWESLVPQQQNSYEFWYRYYIWEMIVWSNHAVRERHSQLRQLQTPSNATNVLRKGMEERRMKTMDYPEQLIQMFVNHCEQHESVLALRSALMEARKATITVQYRRAKEVSMANEAAAQGYDPSATKRKRDGEPDVDEAITKKSRPEGQAAVAASVEQPVKAVSEAPSEQKRDREHTSVIVKKLPSGTTQVQLRKFFTDCGNVRGILLKPEGDTVTATVEFDSTDEANYAMSKQVKGFEGADIDISLAGSTQLFVANYPPTADDAYMRKLFGQFGDILEVRFPSLKFNTHRRFCYVQFSTAEEAIAATKLDGTTVDGLKLTAKISNPGAAKKRDGATSEGREVYIWHLDFKATQDDVKGLFGKFGTIERIKLPQQNQFKRTNRGFAFVVYENKENAEAAVAEMHGQVYRGLELHVEIAAQKAEGKKEFKSELRLDTQNPKPESPEDAADGHKGSSDALKPIPFYQRSIVLLHIPDTVKDARIGALVEPFGAKKVEMMPRKSSAIVEFKTVEDAGRASLALQRYEIMPGHRLDVGSKDDLKNMRNEHFEASALMKPILNRPVKRPTAKPAASKRGGLGFRGRVAGTVAASSSAGPSGTNGEPGKKSNADFRAMFMAPKDEAKDEAKDGKTDAAEGDKMEE
ncbi:hypothetical protein GQ43DRAFT_241414 [Delitschia confertaspora ATCC 74209]|uniref:U4/U6 snRNA-associated-splicing factor PRP24 n=1 Tax=Delitschia confertaspora ATCC 74209 TaxID=1513339 RepID=A0A9P4MN86_9PLEO|nr:hypothetical protein GQ43DRAFT_241414 [Delitschia confertaspora ATCC 74209]